MTEQTNDSPLLSFDEQDRQHGWDATSVKSFEKCPRYYKYKHIEGWQSKHKSVHLVFGGIYAAALEQYYKHVFAGVDADEAVARIVRAALLETWSHDRTVAGERIEGTGEPWDSMHNAKTRETLIRSIVWYLDHFTEDTTTTVELSDGRPAVEYSFSIPLDGDIQWCGHIDRLVRYGDDIYVMDQKTSGTTITARYFEGFTPDIQMSGYTWAGQIIFDLPVKGVIIDAAQIAVGFTRFERGFIHRSQYHLDEWFESTLATIEAARRATTDGFFSMNRESCGNYGGCEFRKICSRLPKHRPSLLEVDFRRERRWDPLERR